MDDVVEIDPSAAPAAGASGQGGGSEQDPQQQQQAEPTIADVMKLIQGMQGHVGRISAIQSRVDAMPKTVETLVQQRLAESTRQLQLSQLSPEQRAEYQKNFEESERQQAELKKMIHGGIKELLPSEYGGMVEYYQRQQDKEAADGFFQSIEEAIGAEDMQKIAPEIDAMLKEHERKIKSSDPTEVQEAITWMDKAMKAPEAIALQALRRAQEKVQEGAGQVIDERRKAAVKLGQGPRGAAPRAPQNLRGITDQKELDRIAASMSTEEFEKLLKASR